MSDDKLSNLQPAMQTAESLRGAGAATGAGAIADRATAAPKAPPTLAQRTAGLVAAEAGKPPAQSCQQCLYVSIFFDGTGNNAKADLPTQEHSNVVRMFRAMPLDNPATGVFSRYIPGIGTLFPEIGDNGKGPIPLVDTHMGMGAMGQDRLDYAFKELAAIIAAAAARAQNPTNKIVWIKLAVFGFSRGATLARAFVRDLVDPKLGKTIMQGTSAFWAQGRYPLSVEFMGLWDTVASVGLPLSANNVDAVRSSRRAAGNTARLAVNAGFQMQPNMLRAVDLAFGQPGADPSPGSNDGHGAWADGLAIPPTVKTAVHMVAAHEVRNSFPVDSLQRGRSRSANCKEMVYPGVHSDVGGGYRAGEGGKGVASSGGATDDATLLLSLIPLHAMYEEALAAGVPVRKQGSQAWGKDNVDDFSLSAVLADHFNHYMNLVGWGGRPLGDAVLAHMRVYFAWRWYRIANGRGASSAKIKSNEAVFSQDRQALERQRADLQRQRAAAGARYATAAMRRDHAAQQVYGYLPGSQQASADVAARQAEMAAAQADMQRLDALLKENQARIDGAANDIALPANLSEYDAELVNDARSILDAIHADPGKRKTLRPHYRNLIETYEDQFVHGRGLKDPVVIAFFDDHVHDSLAAFAKDSTLPSDPRVIYVGADAKLDYAMLQGESDAVPA
jgi:hypothetical protein